MSSGYSGFNSRARADLATFSSKCHAALELCRMSQNFGGLQTFDFSMRSTSFRIFWIKHKRKTNKKWPIELPTSRSRAETFRIPPVENSIVSMNEWSISDSNVQNDRTCVQLGGGTKYVKINEDHIEIETCQSLQCICMATGSVFCHSFLSLSYLRSALLHGS